MAAPSIEMVTLVVISGGHRHNRKECSTTTVSQLEELDELNSATVVKYEQNCSI